METLAWGSVAESTQRNDWGKWKIWVEERRLQGKGPWLHELGDTDQVLEEVLEFMASRCFVHNNQQSTVRGYLAAIKYYHNMCTGWELPTSHCMIVSVGKGIDRAHGMTPKKSTVRLPLTWSILSQGRRIVATTVDEGVVMWLGLALSYFLLCRASELWAYADGIVHPEFCLTRNSLTFLSGEERLSFENRECSAGAVSGVEKRPEARGVHDHPNKGRGGGVGRRKPGRSLRSPAGASKRTPPTPRGGPAHRQAHAFGLECFYPYGSGSSVEVDGWK